MQGGEWALTSQVATHEQQKVALTECAGGGGAKNSKEKHYFAARKRTHSREPAGMIQFLICQFHENLLILECSFLLPVRDHPAMRALLQRMPGYAPPGALQMAVLNDDMDRTLVLHSRSNPDNVLFHTDSTRYQ